jgi:hypothetical protein
VGFEALEFITEIHGLIDSTGFKLWAIDPFRLLGHSRKQYEVIEVFLAA